MRLRPLALLAALLAAVPTAAAATPDRTPPRLVITAPWPGALLDTRRMTIRGWATDAGSGVARLTLNGRPLARSRTGVFRARIVLRVGANRYVLRASDAAGNSVTVRLTVRLRPARKR